ncbi:Protein N-acetyltransferase, RimJ/RimL family [Alteromonadaceae bacterium Bs31]|nr:Protein N-acetyltransferase, RimJ/RimL family [Alteromonadaceae bacterium Bs31]
MNKYFTTKRLEVNFLAKGNKALSEAVVELLTDEVTQYLPPDWQGISEKERAAAWLEARIKESSVFTIKACQAESLMGFLFVYGLEVNNSEVRIGYILSEKYWGYGYASELVGGLLAWLKQVGNVTSVIAGVTKGHASSIKVLTKNGFILSTSKANTHFYSHQLAVT